MDIEILLNTNFSDALYMLNPDMPEELIISVDFVNILDSEGNKIKNPTDKDIVDNEYDCIITRYFLDNYDEKYIKYQATFTGIKNNYLVYSVKIIKIYK